MRELVEHDADRVEGIRTCVTAVGRSLLREPLAIGKDSRMVLEIARRYRAEGLDPGGIQQMEANVSATLPDELEVRNTLVFMLPEAVLRTIDRVDRAVRIAHRRLIKFTTLDLQRIEF